MSAAKLWNTERKKYERYDLPDGSSLFETEMETTVVCAYCREENTYGDMYTSRRIHNSNGLGYVVCGNCYYENDVNFFK